ncbi:hypothetical protein [Clostridium sp. UBA6640]|uniref:hypothetical protein n=1 Tax=Clostridium sp. UBA6640 TaxID=1946370 RepID=UPI0025B94E1E|nr:hypothetical protein [Clostridium sp. UBA6640]
MDIHKILKYIYNAWTAAIACSLITLGGIIISVLGNSDLGLSLYSLVDVVLLLGLGFGVYKKSRVCAVILFVCFTLNQLYTLSSGMSNGGGIILSLALGRWFFQGIVGTIDYHKIKKIEIYKNFDKF